MPSFQSQLFTRIAGQRVKRLFDDFDLDRARRAFARQDRWFSRRPANVEIEAVSLSHCEADWIRPAIRTDRFVIYIPGGAWVMRTPNIHRHIAARLATSANANVLLVFYRLAPENPFPAGLEDCIEAYGCLLDSGINASQIIIGGDSAGGNLALAALLRLRDDGLPLPAAAFALSPCTDMSFGPGGCPMPEDHQDPMVSVPGYSSDQDPRKLYVAGDETLLDGPYTSPARANLEGLCPILIHVGSTELVREQCLFFAERAKRAGVPVELEVWDGQPHVFHGLPFPESAAAFDHLGDYIRHRTVSELDPIESRGARILQGLRMDHGRFGRVLTMIGRDAWRLVEEPESVLELFSEAVDYIANHQNVLHHPLEDEIFSLLADKSSDHREVIERLAGEHEIAEQTGQNLLRLLREVSTDDRGLPARVKLADALQGFARNMRAHIRQEEKLLYSAAWHSLTGDEWLSVTYSEPHDEPLGDDADPKYPLLAAYVLGSQTESEVIFRPDRLNEALGQVLQGAGVCADRVVAINKMAFRQQKEALALTFKSITSMPLFPLLSPGKTLEQTKNSLSEFRSAMHRWQKEWRDSF